LRLTRLLGLSDKLIQQVQIFAEEAALT